MSPHESDHYVVQKFRRLNNINLEKQKKTLSFISKDFKQNDKTKWFKYSYDQYDLFEHQTLN